MGMSFGSPKNKAQLVLVQQSKSQRRMSRPSKDQLQLILSFKGSPLVRAASTSDISTPPDWLRFAGTPRITQISTAVKKTLFESSFKWQRMLLWLRMLRVDIQSCANLLVNWLFQFLLQTSSIVFGPHVSVVPENNAFEIMALLGDSPLCLSRKSIGEIIPLSNFHTSIVANIRLEVILGGVFKYFYFHPYLGRWSTLTNIFQMGWNHQPAFDLSLKEAWDSDLIRFVSLDSFMFVSTVRAGRQEMMAVKKDGVPCGTRVWFESILQRVPFEP